jgi:hypothetical protein
MKASLHVYDFMELVIGKRLGVRHRWRRQRPRIRKRTGRILTRISTSALTKCGGTFGWFNGLPGGDLSAGYGYGGLADGARLAEASQVEPDRSLNVEPRRVANEAVRMRET